MRRGDGARPESCQMYDSPRLPIMLCMLAFMRVGLQALGRSMGAFSDR